MLSTSNWYALQDADKIDTPALLVYPDRVEQNIVAAINMTGNPDRLRPHIKTHKTKEVTALLMKHGVHQFKCATIAEAELLGMSGARDVLLAYQPLGPKLDRFIALMHHYKNTVYACLTDNITAATTIAKKASEHKIVIPVYIDLNVGMNRTGIVPESALELVAFCLQQPSLKLMGLHAYDGHLRNPDPEKRKQECDEGFKRVTDLQTLIYQQYQFNLPIIAGGSPSFPIHAQREDVVCSPGTFVYWDYGYGYSFPEQPFKHAALVITRIVSLPAPGMICTDLGHKSIAAENTIDKRVVFLNATDLIPVSQSEEHLVLKAPIDHTYKPGDILYGLPYHICPTCALYERAYAVEDQQAKNEWMIIGRNRKIIY